MNKKVAIFAGDAGRGFNFLKLLVGEMKYKDVDAIYPAPRRMAVLTDGTEYRVLPANDSMRGHKFSVAYVSTLIPDEFIKTRIFPSFYPTNDINLEYFDESELE